MARREYPLPEAVERLLQLESVGLAGRPEEGELVRCEGRVWFVGLVNEARARLDPITGSVVQADPTSGRSFTSYGQSINVGATAPLEKVDLEDLDDRALMRYMTIVERWEEEKKAKAERQAAGGTTSGRANGRSPQRYAEQPDPTSLASEAGDEDSTDADTNTGTTDKETTDEEGSMAVAEQPVKSLKERNAERLAQLKAKKEASKTEKAAAKSVSAPREKKEKTLNSCKCGCGGTTGGHFVPGHDARFKGWLLAIERGEDIVGAEGGMPQAVYDQYKWVKRGKGKIPTKNYKGEPHTPFLAEPAQ